MSATAGACNSFAVGTAVLTADGSTKEIADLQVGDKVVATDPETGETVTKTSFLWCDRSLNRA
ncbi:hypothetical protein [Streptomyces lavendulae]